MISVYIVLWTLHIYCTVFCTPFVR